MEAISIRATEAYAALQNDATRREYDQRRSIVPATSQRSNDSMPPRVATLAPPPLVPPARADVSSGITILVVEDDAALRAMLVRCLADIGRVVEARDGATALALAIERHTSLVITDVMMPGMDGLELARQLKANPLTARVPILMLTAKTRPKDVIDGVNAGARSYITKPFKMDELRNRVHNALGLSKDS
jgi:CheY-like chemotaxis protein